LGEIANIHAREKAPIEIMIDDKVIVEAPLPIAGLLAEIFPADGRCRNKGEAGPILHPLHEHILHWQRDVPHARIVDIACIHRGCGTYGKASLEPVRHAVIQSDLLRERLRPGAPTWQKRILRIVNALGDDS
jgi:hypothetical protein